MKIKNGMGGSRCGRGRREPTAILKANSKGPRRQQARKEVAEVLNDTGPLPPSVYNPEADYESLWEAMSADMESGFGSLYADPYWDEVDDFDQHVDDLCEDPLDDWQMSDDPYPIDPYSLDCMWDD